MKIRPPRVFIGKSLRELDLPTRMSLTPIALRRGKNVTVNPHRDERVARDDELILIGLDERLERLGESSGRGGGQSTGRDVPR